MFYETFCRLCQTHNLTPSGAATKIGFNRASVTMWKNTGKAPKQELLIKIANFFGVTTDYLLGNDHQANIDSLAFQISQLKEEIRTASAERKEELESTLFILEESYEDLVFAQQATELEKEHKKISSDELVLTEGEKAFIKLLRRRSAEGRAVLLDKILADLDEFG